MFESITGHERQKNLLEKQIANGEVSHAYLFSGSEGIGKKKLAEDFLAELMKTRSSNPERTARRVLEHEHPDYHVIPGEDKSIKIAQIREILAAVQVKPLEAGYQCVLIDHAEKMTAEAQNALLKTLEEPPEDVVFVLVTAYPDQILPTVLSRCEKLTFSDLSEEENQKVLSELGLSSTHARTPREAMAFAARPQLDQELDEMAERFDRIVRGDAAELFPFAEEISKDSEFSKQVLVDLIRRIHQRTLDHPEQAVESAWIEGCLFELLEKLQYNINLRLQWEHCLIKLTNHWS